MYKIGVNLECVYTDDIPFEKKFAAAKADGFDVVEVWGWDDKDPQQVRKLLEENGQTMSIMSGDGPFSMCDPNTKDQYLEYLKKGIEAAKIIGVKVLNIHSDALEDWPQYAKPLSEDFSDIRKYIAIYEILKEVAVLAEENDLIFTIEPLNIFKDHKGNFLDTTAKTVELIKAVGSDRIKVLYDSYHQYLNEGKICEITEMYLPYIQHIHIADAPGRHEPGTGVINFKAYLQFLKKIGFEGSVGFELYPETDTPAAIKAIKAVME